MTEGAERTDEHLLAGRREHHREILAAGGYPYRFQRTALASELTDEFAGLGPGIETERRVAVAGRVMLHRSFGKLQFATLRDSSGTIQLFVDQSTAGEELSDRFSRVDLGDWVGAFGTIMTTKRGELSVRVDELSILQKSLRPLPDKWHGLADVETRSRRRYLDLMANEQARQVALTRVAVISRLRKEFSDRGFIEVDTPMLLAQATGALARPFLTHHNTLDIELQLRIATELYLKRLVVAGLEKVFEIGRIFRNEGIDATHNPEFTMLEAYEALADYYDIMGLVEEVFAGVAEAVLGGLDLDYQGRRLSLRPPYPRVTMIELASRVAGEEVSLDTDPSRLRELAEARGTTVEDDASPGRLLFQLYEQAHRQVWEPTIVLDFPREVSPLARSHREDPRLVERFELVIAGAEYCNAFSELNDPEDQRARFESQATSRAGGDQEAHVIDEDYLTALEYGLPPTGGLGIGVDRLVMLLTDQAHIREVILFPTLRPESTEGDDR